MTVTTQNVQMHAPTDPTYKGQSNVNGRAYKVAAGSPVLVPDYDADSLEAAGWTRSNSGGTTAQRPASPVKGAKFDDTTVGASIVWDGKTWRHAVTGASV